MAKIKINKLEAARRQIDAAIRMLFSEEDPVCVHTLAMAGFRILRDLDSQRDDSYMEKIIDLTIKPGRKTAFWGAMNSFSNFLKHADRDPNGIYDGVDEYVNDVVLFVASLYYQDLGHQYTPEMSALACWFIALHPEFLCENENPKLRVEAEAVGASIKVLTRRKQLAVGKQLISFARNMGQGPEKGT